MTFHITERFSAPIVPRSSTFITTPVGLQPVTSAVLANAQEGCRHHHSQNHVETAFWRQACVSEHGLCHVLDLSGQQQTLAGVSCSLRVLGPYQAA